MRILKFAGLVLLLSPIGGRAQNYIISTFAGGAAPPSGVPGTSAKIGAPDDLITDSNGNFYFVSLNSAFRLDMNGTLTRVAGTGVAAYSGDGGPGPSAKLSAPLGIALDGSGNVYIADTGNNRIRRVTPNGTITTVAGTGMGGNSGDGGPALNAQLNHPGAIVFDGSGNFYILEAARIRKVSPSGIVTTIAGTGVAGETGDNGPAISAQIKATKGLAIDGPGNLYFSDISDQRVRKISTDGTITTVAGTTGVTPGTQTGTLNLPDGVAVDGAGNVYIAEINGLQVVSPGGNLTNVSVPGSAPFAVSTVAVDNSGNLYFADGTFTIRKLTSGGAVTTLAGPGGPVVLAANASPTSVTFDQPTGVAVDADGNVLIADTQDAFLWRVSPSGTINITGDVQGVNGIAIDGSGNYYALGPNGVTKAHFTGSAPPTPVVVAGGGTSSADGIAATSAQVLFARGIAVDAAGDIFIADARNHKVRKISTAGIITTIAGTGTQGFSGDGGAAANAQLNAPFGVAVDATGNIFIADTGNFRIRKVSAADGSISTLAGGNGSLDHPVALASDAAGNLYVADADQIRKITNGTITTIAGTGIVGYSGDGGIAAAAMLGEPTGVAVDSRGNVYIAEQGNNVVRVLHPTNAPVTISAVVDAASESSAAVTPGKIVAIYGAGLGPVNAVINVPQNNAFGPAAGGSSVTINGLAAPMIYASAGQIDAIVPYGVAGSMMAQVVVSSANGTSTAFSVPVAAASPSFFSQNSSGSGQIAAVNLDGSFNDAAHPVAIGGYISLYATGEGQTSPAGVDGALAMSTVLPKPVLQVSVTVGGIAVTPTYAGAAPTEVAGLMQIVVQIPAGVTAGGYVPVDVQVGSEGTVSGAAWIAISGK